jgi:hypothetical protein
VETGKIHGKLLLGADISSASIRVVHDCNRIERFTTTSEVES